MSFKVGDKVRLNKKGIEESGHWFKDGVYENLEIQHVERKGTVCVWQHNKEIGWWVHDYEIELMPNENDPSTWRRNTPIVIQRDNGQVSRHFARFEKNRIYFYPQGKTSFSYGKGNVTNLWEFPERVRKATKEELK